MKRRGEKRRKFHESLLQILYPPPPPPQEDNQESIDTLSQNPNLDYVPDELDEDIRSTSSTDAADEEEGDEPKKLTRAQRKRLRRKKLKEAASRRRNIIGPLLPTGEGGGDAVEEKHPGVREYAAEKDGNTRADKPESEETLLGSKQNKLKQRRMAKKLAAGESVRPSSTVNSNEDARLCEKGNA